MLDQLTNDVAIGFVYHLPFEIIVELMEVSKLDRCVSHLIMRRKFFDAISHVGVVYNGVKVKNHAVVSYLAWLYSRNISVRILVVPRGPASLDIGYFLQGKVCMHLTKMDFSEGPNLSNFELEPILTSCPNLEEFHHCEFGWDNVVNDQLVSALCTKVPKLKAFTLRNNRLLRDQHIQDLAVSCTCLREITLGNCFGVSNYSLLIIASHCPRLTKLGLNVLESLKDDGLIAIATHCPNLAAVAITACGFTGAAIEALCRNCAQLQELSLSALLFTDATLAVIAANCANLRQLKLWRVPRITEAGVMTVVEGCPNLTYLELYQNIHISDGFRARVEALPGRNIQCREPVDVL